MSEETLFEMTPLFPFPTLASEGHLTPPCVADQGPLPVCLPQPAAGANTYESWRAHLRASFCPLFAIAHLAPWPLSPQETLTEKVLSAVSG